MVAIFVYVQGGTFSSKTLVSTVLGFRSVIRIRHTICIDHMVKGTLRENVCLGVTSIGAALILKVVSNVDITKGLRERNAEDVDLDVPTTCLAADRFIQTKIGLVKMGAAVEVLAEGRSNANGQGATRSLLAIVSL